MYPLALHRHLSAEKWNAFPKAKQILMIANELNRAGHSIERSDPVSVRKCDERAFELIDMTVDDPKWRGTAAGELLRFREVLAERYASESMNYRYNRALLRILLQMHPESAKIIGS
jgi:hypothetical protein